MTLLVYYSLPLPSPFHTLETPDIIIRTINNGRATTSPSIGGRDTSVSFLYNSFLVIQLYTEVQRKAQKEFSYVIGIDKVHPGITDRPILGVDPAC